MAGRPQAPRQISNVVIPTAMLAAVDLSPREIYGKMNDKLQWLQWLAEHRLVRNSAVCGRCAMPMALVARAEVSDGYSWRCRDCQCRSSVRADSFFSNCDLTTEQITMIMFFWLHQVKLKHVLRFEDISWPTGVNYNNYFRLECRNWLANQNPQLGGFDVNGGSIFVEVDESYFFHRKYHRGNRRRGEWVVGLVERDTCRCWLEIVRRRDAATLERIIAAHVLPGTTIVTDAWQGYRNVSNINNGIYKHEVVVHANNFIDPIHSEIHTETIEGVWMQAKRKIRFQGGTSRGLFPSYLTEFQWRYSHKENVFGHYLRLLSDNYNI